MVTDEEKARIEAQDSHDEPDVAKAEEVTDGE